MLRYISLLLIVIVSVHCNTKKSILDYYPAYDEAAIIEKNSQHEKTRMQYKLVHSKVLDKLALQATIAQQIKDFSMNDYEMLKPLIFEQDIPSIQESINSGELTYKKLTQWYLFRIHQYEFDPNTSLHTIISINANAVEVAMKRDEEKMEGKHPIFGMPILLKDNINTAEMPTTAGAIALQQNTTDDAFIVERLKEKGAIILGKVNLSEWAYYFCSGCPVGYSAVGGQTLNPYGRTEFETGGSSSGSGTAVAANYAVGAVGTETSGSILSPSSQNSVVGLKPTVGLLSRTGIVPISSTLDTPGPMTKNVTDNAILLSAMIGIDPQDSRTSISYSNYDFMEGWENTELVDLKLGANKNFMNDQPLYAQMMLDLNRMGIEIYGFEPGEVSLDGFLTILNIEMKHDLPAYLSKFASDKVSIKNVEDVIQFNEENKDIRAPYGQGRFEGIVADQASVFKKDSLFQEGQVKARAYFDEPMDEFDLDVFTSINNFDAGRAALAHYPALTIPMGYKEDGEPMNLTLIAKSGSEKNLLKIGALIEQATKRRRPPSGMD